MENHQEQSRTHNCRLYPRTYADVVKFFNGISHVRTDSPDVRRLYNSRHIDKTITKRGDSYVIRLYKTNLIEYTPTHCSITAGGWTTQTTFKVLDHFSNIRVSNASWHGNNLIPREYAYVWSPPHDLQLKFQLSKRSQDSDGNVLGFNDYTLYGANSSDWYDFTYPEDNTAQDVVVSQNQFVEPIKFKVDRKAMRDLRRSHDFLPYAKALIKLLPEVMTSEELAKMQREYGRSPISVISDWWTQEKQGVKDNPYKHELLMTMLVHTNYSERSYSQNNRLVTEISIKAFTRVFDQYFKRMNPQVLVPA